MAKNGELLKAYADYKEAVAKSKEEALVYKTLADESLKTINELLTEVKELEETLPSEVREKMRMLRSDLEDTVTLENLSSAITCWEQQDAYLGDICETSLKKAGFLK